MSRYADVLEFIQILDGVVHVTSDLINVSDLLVALGLLVGVLHSLGHLQTLFEELQTARVITILLVLHGNLLVDAHQVLGNLLEDDLQVAFSCFLKGGFKIVLRLKFI